MNFLPLFQGEWAVSPVTFIPAIIVGFFFGFVLERSGFGDARILAAQFYLHNMRVFKVMFGAIVTAAVGLALALSFGWLNWAALWVPETFLWPHLVGGFLLGVGFIVSGYCPGTSIVAAASGHWDGLVVVVGVILGSVLFGEIYPLIADFHVSGAQGVLGVSDLTSIGYPILVAGLAMMAAGAFFGAEKVETIFSKILNKEKEASWTPGAIAGLGGLVAAAAIAAVAFVALPQTVAAPEPPARLASISVVEAASMVVEQPRSLFVVDLRQATACSEGKQRLPYAVCFAEIEADIDLLTATRTLVVYGQEKLEVADLPPALLRFPGEVAVIEGGYNAWHALIVQDKPSKELLASLTPQQKSLIPALHSYFTGSAVKVQPAVPRPKVKRKLKKGGGCS